jgi:Adenine/guanine phosphoribosyltransferases and related PRPP-binding proteins
MENWKDRIEFFENGVPEIGTIWSRGDLLAKIAGDLASLADGIEFDAIATAETKGIIYASALAVRMGKPLLIFRKIGRIKMTDHVYSEEFTNWRNEPDGLEIEKELLSDQRILFVDDVISTTSTVAAVSRILGGTNCCIVKYLCFANASKLKSFDGIEIRSLLESR